jgi:hypothetical protein
MDIIPSKSGLKVIKKPEAEEESAPLIGRLQFAVKATAKSSADTTNTNAKSVPTIRHSDLSL